MEEMNKWLIKEISDLIDYNNVNREFNGDIIEDENITKDKKTFIGNNVSVNFLISMYVSIRVMDLSSEYILHQKADIRKDIENDTYENILNDSKRIHKYMFDSHRDACFREIFTKSDDIIEMLLDYGEKWDKVLVNFTTIMSEMLIHSFVRSGINVANRSTESIFSIITQAILDTHRKSSSKGGSSILSVANVIQGTTPKNPFFSFKHSSISDPVDIINFLTTNIYGVKMSDIIIEYREYTPNEIRAIDIYDIYSISQFDSIIITIDTIKQALYGISFDDIIGLIYKIFDKFFNSIKDINVFYPDPNIKIPNIRIIVILELLMINQKIKQNLLERISGINDEKNIKNNLDDTIETHNISSSLNPNISETIHRRILDDEINVKYLSNSISDKNKTIKEISDSYTSSDEIFTKYIITHIMMVLYEQNISGVSDSELPEYKINNFHDQIKDIHIINDYEYMLIIDNIELKSNGFLRDTRDIIHDSTNSKLDFIKVSCIRFIIYDIELYLWSDEIPTESDASYTNSLTNFLTILKSKTMFPDNIHLYTNSILFYPYIETNILNKFRQTLINFNVIKGDMEEIIYFEHKFLLKLSEDFTSLFKNQDTLKSIKRCSDESPLELQIPDIEIVLIEQESSNPLGRILENFSKDYISLLDDFSPVRISEHTEFNRCMNYGKFSIINKIVDKFMTPKFFTGEFKRFIKYDDHMFINEDNINIWVDNISEMLHNQLLKSLSFIIYTYIDLIIDVIIDVIPIESTEIDEYNAIISNYKSIQTDFDPDDIFGNYKDKLLDIFLSNIPITIISINRISSDLSFSYISSMINATYENIKVKIDINISDIKSVLYNTRMKIILSNLRDKIIHSVGETNIKYIKYDTFRKFINEDADLSDISQNLFENDYYILDDYLQQFIIDNFHVEINKENIKSLIKSYNIETYIMSAYNGNISDYISKIDNSSNIMYQDVDDISIKHGILSADQAYYSNIIGFLMNSGMNISAIHIEIRSVLMTYEGVYKKITPTSVTKQPNPIIASRRDPKAVFTYRCTKPIMGVPSDDIIFGSASLLGRNLKYVVECKDGNCDKLDYHEPTIEESCINCNESDSNFSFSDDKMTININTHANSSRYVQTFDERLNDPDAYTDIQNTGTSAMQDPDFNEYSDFDPYQMFSNQTAAVDTSFTGYFKKEFGLAV